MAGAMNDMNAAALLLRARIAATRLGVPACVAIALCAAGAASWAWLLPKRAAQAQVMAQPLPAPSTLVTPPPPPSAISARSSPAMATSSLPNTLKASLTAASCGDLPAQSDGYLVVDSDYAPAAFRLLTYSGSTPLDLWAYAE